MLHTNTRERSPRRGPTGALARGLVAAVCAGLLATACNPDSLLDVQVPNSVPSDIFSSPTYATLMVNSVIGDFECAFGSFVLAEGLASDELHDSALNNATWNIDRRDNAFSAGVYGTRACTAVGGTYTPLSTARGEADAAIQALAKWTVAEVPNITVLTAQANLYSGFSYATLGMAMCQAAFDKGPLVDQKGMFALAEQRFTAAIAAAGTSLPNVLYAAYLGRARVRLYQHNNAGAIADAQQVPAGFVFNAAMDATNSRRYNRVYTNISTSGILTVEPTARALTTETGQVDPRSAMIKLNTAPADGVQLIYIPAKFNAATLAAGQAIPHPIARYAEAQLILAEAQLGAPAVAIINTMRAAVSLNPYTGPIDDASVKALIASERQRVLFLEGFRAYDIERLNLALVPAVGSAYSQGGVYGGTVCFPLPDIEKNNNPNIVASQIITGVRGQFTIP